MHIGPQRLREQQQRPGRPPRPVCRQALDEDRGEEEAQGLRPDHELRAQQQGADQQRQQLGDRPAPPAGHAQ